MGLKKSKRAPDDEKWLKSLGKHISKLIKKKGYESAYNFWVQALGDASLSRSNLDYILKGQVDVQASTLKKIADGLEVPVHQLLKF